MTSEQIAEAQRLAREWLWLLGCVLAGIVAWLAIILVGEAALDWPNRIGWFGVLVESMKPGTAIGLFFYFGIGILRLTVSSIRTLVR